MKRFSALGFQFLAVAGDEYRIEIFVVEEESTTDVRISKPVTPSRHSTQVHRITQEIRTNQPSDRRQERVLVYGEMLLRVSPMVSQ